MLNTESCAGSDRSKIACALAVAGKMSVRRSASGKARAPRKNRWIVTRDKMEASAFLRSLRKPVCVVESIYLYVMSLQLVQIQPGLYHLYRLYQLYHLCLLYRGVTWCRKRGDFQGSTPIPELVTGLCTRQTMPG